VLRHDGPPTAKPSLMILQSMANRRQSYSRHKIAEFVASKTKGELSGCRLCPLSKLTICSVRSGLVGKRKWRGTRHLLKPRQ
jgi:hypothetical protein